MEFKTDAAGATMTSDRTPSRIPRRSHSLRMRGERVLDSIWSSSLASRNLSTFDDDLDSLQSFGSTMSCDHAFFGRNGTTFSGRSMKYVVHCSSHGGETDEYLTPTQRANRQIRHLKSLLCQARKEITSKDQEIMRLTKEVVELRFLKASLNDSPDGADVSQDDGTSNDASPIKDDNSFLREESSGFITDENSDSKQKSEQNEADNSLVLEKLSSVDLPSSLADSGHFEDIAMSSMFSKESLTQLMPLPRTPVRGHSEDREGERTSLVNLYEQRIEGIVRNHIDEMQELKEKHNDKVESLLQRLSDVNTRYCELRGDYDHSQDMIRQLQQEKEALKKTMDEQEERHKNMYLKMYMKGQEAARFEHADQVLEFAHQAPSRVSVPELLQQLRETESELENIKQETTVQLSDNSQYPKLTANEAISLWLLGTRKAMYRRLVEAKARKGELDPEMTLQFLKSAVYYFLTDKENHQGHLNAIKSILGYTEEEKKNIEKIYRLYSKK